MARTRYVEPPPEGHATPQQLADRWGVSEKTVRRWLNKRWLEGKRRGPRRSPATASRWIVSEEAAAAWEQTHPRLKAQLNNNDQEEN